MRIFSPLIPSSSRHFPPEKWRFRAFNRGESRPTLTRFYAARSNAATVVVYYFAVGPRRNARLSRVLISAILSPFFFEGLLKGARRKRGERGVISRGLCVNARGGAYIDAARPSSPSAKRARLFDRGTGPRDPIELIIVRC